MPNARYSKQERGGDRAYDRYLAGMNASMRQKVALTAAHLLSVGHVADMGMGSGAGSHALASLYPDLEVTGVDVNEEMVKRAAARYPLANLRFVVGDIAKPCLPAQSQDALINSSVLHHVTSFGGYRRQAAMDALKMQTGLLRPGGILVVRDFVDPGPADVLLDLAADDAETLDYFAQFQRQFRSLAPPQQQGFQAVQQTAPDGWCRFRLSHTLAAEFVLRKDYRRDWALEIQEEYTYATQREFERSFSAMGLRVIASTPIWNPWIVRHRFEGKFRLWSLDEEPLDFPATNYVIVGQKVQAGDGVGFVPRGEAPPMHYLQMSHWCRTDTTEVYDLARRPGTTVDVLPWFKVADALHVLARRSYPRPIPALHPETLDGCLPPTWVTEPLNVQQGDASLPQTVTRLLDAFDGIDAARIRDMRPGTRFYPSPGGLQEQVRSVLVEVDPVAVDEPNRDQSGWSSSGLLRSMEARQLLRAAQVGALPDARLEIAVYELLLREGMDPGPWIGESLDVSHDLWAPSASITSCIERPGRQLFREVDAAQSTGFLKVKAVPFDELDAQGQPLGSQTLEHVVPAGLSSNTICVALLRRSHGQLQLGLDDHDLPAVQCFEGRSDLWVTPAWRLPEHVTGRDGSRAWLRQQLRQQYGLTCGPCWELGGRFHPSVGVTPEVVYPLAMEVLAQTAAARDLTWVALRALIDQRQHLPDGHLRVVTLRAAHALNLLNQRQT